mgnify:CR=1 FL=1
MQCRRTLKVLPQLNSAYSTASKEPIPHVCTTTQSLAILQKHSMQARGAKLSNTLILPTGSGTGKPTKPKINIKETSFHTCLAVTQSDVICTRVNADTSLPTDCAHTVSTCPSGVLQQLQQTGAHHSTSQCTPKPQAGPCSHRHIHTHNHSQGGALSVQHTSPLLRHKHRHLCAVRTPTALTDEICVRSQHRQTVCITSAPGTLLPASHIQ